jgi:ankyrin repeat protein
VSQEVEDLLLAQATAELLDMQDQDGHTALLRAAAAGKVHLPASILERGGDIHLADNEGRMPIHMTKRAIIVRHLLSAGADANCRDSCRMTPLHYASRRGNEGVVMKLLEVGAEVDKICSSGFTALYYASMEGHAGVVKLLLKARADAMLAGLDGGSPIHAASQLGHVDLINPLLLTDNISVDQVKKIGGLSPLHMAC